MSRLSDDAVVLAEAATLLTTPLNLPAAIAGDAVTDPAAATASDPSAASASNPTTPAALTQAAVTDSLTDATFTGTALTTGATPTVDELETAFGVVGGQLNAARTDIIALRAEVVTYETAISANIVDIAGNRTEIVALIVDVADLRTQVSALLTSLEAAGLIAT